MRIATYNIRRGGSRRGPLIGEVLREMAADLMVLQEATDPNVVRTLAEASEAEVVLTQPGRSVAVLSRMGPLEAHWHHQSRRHSLAEVLLPEPGLRLIGAHLAAGLSGRGERRRSLEVERLLAVANSPPGLARTLVVGDLNAVAPGELPHLASLPTWIRILVRFDGGIGTAAMGQLLAAGFTDAYRRLNPDDVGDTLPAAAPHVRLDYLLLGADLVPAATACAIPPIDRALLATASDHLPLTLDLDLDAVGPDTHDRVAQDRVRQDRTAEPEPTPTPAA